MGELCAVSVIVDVSKYAFCVHLHESVIFFFFPDGGRFKVRNVKRGLSETDSVDKFNDLLRVFL